MSSRHLTVMHPVLFAAYAVLFLYAENLRDTFPADLARPLLLAVAGAALCLAAASLALKSIDRGALPTAALVVSFFFLYAPLSGAVQDIEDLPANVVDLYHGPLTGLAYICITAAALAASLVLVKRGEPHLTSLNSALTVASLVLIAFPMVNVVPYLSSGRSLPGGEPSGISGSRSTTRDIYHVILDQYGTNEAMQAAFGVMDNDLPAWLGQHGFYVAATARANYNRTTLAMPATLNLEYLDNLATTMGAASTDYRPLHELIQDHRAGRFLIGQGYRYVHLGNWYSPTGNIRSASENRGPGSMTEIEAKLLDGSAVPALISVFQWQPAVPATDQLHVDGARFQFEALARLADEPGPKYVLAHILLPHHPYVFDAAGNHLSPAKRRPLAVRQFVDGQLAYTNAEIKRFIERLLAKPLAEQPIIILNADEGPYPQRASTPTFDWATATQAELRTKYGILDSFYLPPEPNQPASLPQPYPSISSINTYRLIFSRYFGADLPFLPDRAFAARTWERPYDMIEVTDQLTASAP